MKSVLTGLIALAIINCTAFINAATRDPDETDRMLYGSDLYDKEREITYWGRAEMTISDYKYGLGDAEFLKLVSGINLDSLATYRAKT